MSEDFLKDPLSLFSVKGKTAVITGATGAFGAMAAKVLCRGRRQCRDLRQQRHRPEEGRGRMRGARRQGPCRREAAELGGKLRHHRQRRGRPLQSLDILVVASGQNKVAKIVDQKADDFLDVMDVNVTQSWLMARAAGRQMLKQGRAARSS